MRVGGAEYRTIWVADDGWSINVIDQTQLPHHFEVLRLTECGQAVEAIAQMKVRGAPLIGVTAAYGLCLALRKDPRDPAMDAAIEALQNTRPTAVNLCWALDTMRAVLSPLSVEARVERAYVCALQIANDDVAMCEAMGRFGCALIAERWNAGGQRAAVNVLTHCNAGWLATVDWGTALAPVYAAHAAGIPVHVWVDETRPRNQGASLTAWELAEHGVAHTIVADNTGGHLMQHGKVDICFVGTDRTTARGDVCNKIGTYLKALAARDNGVPFYVCAPTSSIDWKIDDGLAQIPIEERSEDEVHWIAGMDPGGEMRRVRITPAQSPAINFAFDVTPARLVTGLITPRGICDATADGLRKHFPELAP